MRSVPEELDEAARAFGLSGWQRFWRLELPYGMPNLLWNMMMSMSGGWFFLVAAEAISVAGQDIKLPGIGAYIALAIEAGNGRAANQPSVPRMQRQKCPASWRSQQLRRPQSSSQERCAVSPWVSSKRNLSAQASRGRKNSWSYSTIPASMAAMASAMARPFPVSMATAM